MAKKARAGKKVEVSIIVRSFNEEKRLPALLEALASQKHESYETILVDSGSTDSTRDIAAAYNLRIHRISPYDFTFGYSLNQGIEIARGNLMAIVSAHCEPCSENWLENLVAPLRQEQVAMSYGRQRGVFCSKFAEVEDFKRIFSPETRTMRPPHFFANNANAAIRRDLWLEHPFDESLTGLEDIEWARHWMEKGREVVYVAEADLFHIHEESWRQVRHRYYREAVAAKAIGIRNGGDVLSESLAEIRYFLNDMRRAFVAADNAAAQRLSFTGRVRESLLFRYHKGLGNAKGLIEPHALETAEERTAILFDKDAEAVVIEGPGKAHILPVHLDVLRPGEVRIAVSHAAISNWDVQLYLGTLLDEKSDSQRYPQIPGGEFSGHVVGMGPKVQGLREGDAVVAERVQTCGHCNACREGNNSDCPERVEMGAGGTPGALARYVTVPARFVHTLAPGSDIRAAVFVEQIAVILKGLVKIGGLPAGKKGSIVNCAVIGSGLKGLLSSMVLEANGQSSTIFARQDEKPQPVKEGFRRVQTDWKQLKNHAVIIETTGDPRCLQEVVNLAPDEAAILTLGSPRGQNYPSVRQVCAGEKTLMNATTPHARDFKAATTLLANLDLTPLLVGELPIWKFIEGFENSGNADTQAVLFDVGASFPNGGNHADRTAPSK